MNYVIYIIYGLIAIVIYGFVIKTTNGRNNRFEYLINSLFFSLCIILYNVLLVLLQYKYIFFILLLGSLIVNPLCYYYLLSTQVKRLHDLNLSGWYLLLHFVPIAGIILYFYLLLKKGNNEKNQYDQPINYSKLLNRNENDYDKKPVLIKEYKDHFIINDIKFNNLNGVYINIEELNKNLELKKYILDNFKTEEDQFRIYLDLSDDEYNNLLHYGNGILIKNDKIIDKNNMLINVIYRNFFYHLTIDKNNCTDEIINNIKKLYKKYSEKENKIVFSLLWYQFKKFLLNDIKLHENIN